MELSSLKLKKIMFQEGTDKISKNKKSAPKKFLVAIATAH